MTRQNDSSGQPVAAPVATWVLTAVLVVTGLLAMVLIGKDPVTPPSQAFLQFNAARADRFGGNTQANPYRVLLLGNSRLKYATWEKAQIDALAKGASRLDVLRLVNNWATFADFEPFLDTLIAAEPDLVVIQLELMSQERSIEWNVKSLRLYLRWLFFRTVGEVWNPEDVDQASLQYETECSNIAPTAAAVDQRLTRTEHWLTHDPQGSSSKAARRFVEELRRRKIPVVFLAIPRSRAMEAARPEASLTSDSLTEDERAAVWRYPHAVADEDFCDTVHLSDAGRRDFTAWITDRLMAIAATGPH
jgi:hypothetical protein